MGGTVGGGKRASATNRARYGADYYTQIGTMGGKSGNTGGFASTVVGKDGLTGKERARKYGEIGGRKSKRYKYPTSSTSQSLSISVSSSVSATSTSPGATPPKSKRRWWDIKR